VRIHVVGGSGSGTTTLGRALAARLSCPHFDSDDYFWLPTAPRFREKCDPAERDARLLADLRAHRRCVESGSLVSWDPRIAALFDAVVFLTIPPSIRMDRLRRREEGRRTRAPRRDRADVERQRDEFLAWAARYDTAGEEQRSRAVHERWLAERACPVLHLDGDLSTVARVERVVTFLERHGLTA